MLAHLEEPHEEDSEGGVGAERGKGRDAARGTKTVSRSHKMRERVAVSVFKSEATMALRGCELFTQ